MHNLNTFAFFHNGSGVGVSARHLFDRDGLSLNGGLIRPQPRRLHQPGVCRDQVSRLQPNEVAGHQMRRLHPSELSAPEDLCLGGSHLLQGLQGQLCLMLLRNGDDGIDHDDDEDDDRIQPVLSPACEPGQGRRCQQHQDHGIFQLLPQLPNQSGLLLLLQLIGAVSLQPLPGLPLGKAQM